MRLHADVRLYEDKEPKGKAQLLGFADLKIDDSFVIKGIRILQMRGEAEDGRFLSFPSRKGVDEKYADIAHPTTAQASKAAKAVVLDAYARAAGA